MKLLRALVLSLPLLSAPLLQATDADACGGCLINQQESTQVTGHRMVLSISNDRTTLWDQITYSGEPSSFAWVLPIKGTAEVGLSSDGMFSALEQFTQVSISSPSINCLPPGCQGPPSNGNSAGAGGMSGGGGVVVLAEEVVGPYETVQISSQDPNALSDWLLGHGYSIPSDIAPVISAYTAEGFNFLALKLVPGQGVDSMRPVRITSDGAVPVLPLRMVAAGTGVTTPITLWILGEGRYEPANFPTFEIKASDLIWNWDTQSSNYSVLKQNAFDASAGKAWLVEAAESFPSFYFEDTLKYTAQFDPTNSGYDIDPMTGDATADCSADLDKLFGALSPTGVWVTRIHGELSRPALANDLNLKASADQSSVERFLQATNAVGTPPECPPPPEWCTDTGSTTGSTTGSGMTGGGGNGSVSESGSGSCAVSTESSLPAAVIVFGGAVLLSATRRRRRKG